jgi:hypothetical protein
VGSEWRWKRNGLDLVHGLKVADFFLVSDFTYYHWILNSREYPDVETCTCFLFCRFYLQLHWVDLTKFEVINWFSFLDGKLNQFEMQRNMLTLYTHLCSPLGLEILLCLLLLVWKSQVEFSSSHRRQAESFLNDQKDSERPCILLWAGRDRLRKQHAYAKSICQHAHKSSHTPPTVLVPDMRISCWAYRGELGPCRREIRRQRHDRSGDQVRYVAATATMTTTETSSRNQDDGLKDWPLYTALCFANTTILTNLAALLHTLHLCCIMGLGWPLLMVRDAESLTNVCSIKVVDTRLRS